MTVGLGKVGSITLYDENGDETEEIVLNASVIGLGLLKSEKHASSVIASKPFCQARFRFTGGLKLSETTYYYGFLREAPIIPQSCQITDLAMDASVCGSETEYQLSPTNGVRWRLEKVADKAGNEILDVSEKEKGKVEISEEGKVTGISPDVEGYYHFKAAVNEAGCEGWFVLRHGVQASTGSCNDPVKGSEYDLAPARNAEGGIMILNNIKNRNNIIDDDPNNYAEIQPGITLLSNDFVVGVQKKDGIISDGQESKRVGFLVDIPTSLLDVNALQFFYIKLYNEGKPVGKNTYTVEDWNVISAGLIGSEKASKTRLGVTVPSDVVFDEFSLWTGGVASIRLSALRIYGALVENGSDECDNPLLGCDDAVIVGDGALDKAYINYDRTGFPALTNLGVGLYGLENLLSGEFDPSKYAYSYTTLDVAGTMQISIKFGRTLTPNHQVGFVVDKKTFLGNVGVIGVTQIKSYYSGSSNPDEPVDEKSDWSVLGADVIGYGDYAYLMFKPNAKFDEIQLITASGVGLLNSTKVYSVFIRTDADGDGIPDCMDPTPCDGDISNMEITSDVCVGDEVVLYGIANFGKGETKTYTVKAKNIDDNSEILINSGFTVSQGDFKLDFVIEKAGRYTITFTTEDNEILTWPQVIVHPLETTWKPTSSSTDWNTWDNWSAGSPWTCTDVIIPTNGEDGNRMSVYPELLEKDFNPCHYIHFEPNTEVVNTHYLTYTKAWVEMALNPNRYYMVSVPLKSVYSGDWFLPRYKEGESDNGRYPDYFKPLNEESLPANRVYPTVYQRIWNNTAVDKLLSGSSKPIGIATSQWTSPFNWLSTPYEKNGDYDFNALSIWVHPLDQATDEVGYEGNYDYIFRFPKEHTTYYYYDEKGKETNIWAQIKRDAKSIGRFIYENEEGKTEFPVKMVYKNEEASPYFLIGNPFMAHLDVAKLFEDNPHLKSIKIYDGTGTNTVINPAKEGLLVTNREGDESTTIAPMQSFFVEVEDENVTSCEVTFTESVLTKAKEGSGWLKSDDRASASENVIRLNALVENMEAGASLYFSSKANDYYRRGEDSELLMDGDVKPDVAVFTTLDGQALDIQQRVNGGEIPVGIYLSHPQEVTFSVVIPKGYDGWTLVDGLENRVYPLLAGQRNEIPLGRMTTNVGRFYLRGASATSNQVITATQPKVACYSEEGSGRLIVRSLGDVMTRCEVYSVGGNMSGMSMMETYEYSLPVSPGVAVVKVYFRDGISSVFKVFVNK